MSGTHRHHKGHEAAGDSEQRVPPLAAEGAARLEQNEGRHKQRRDEVQQRPVHLDVMQPLNPKPSAPGCHATPNP
jgi:hypothetical protein